MLYSQLQIICITTYLYFMIFEALIAAVVIALTSILGALFFGNSQQLIGIQRFVVPVAVGILLSLVLYELIPETLAEAPTYGGIIVALGFIAFYVLANYLHQRFHALAGEDCDRKTAASLLLIGDSIHNMADGVILGTAFLIDPAVGVATAVGLALHEIPQEIVEFGVLIRAGYTRSQAIVRNLISASSIVLGTLLTIALAEIAEGYLWIITGIAAGNLLFLAASELLPRIHGNLKNYGSIWNATMAIISGFVLMTGIITWAHEQMPHDHGDAEYGEHDKHGDDHHDALKDEDHHDESGAHDHDDDHHDH